MPIVPAFKFKFEKEHRIPNIVNVRWLDAVYPRYILELDNGRTWDTLSPHAKTKEQVIDLYYREMRKQIDKQELMCIETAPYRNTYEQIYNEAAQIIYNHGGAIDVDKKSVDDVAFHNFVNTVTNSELAQALRRAREIIENAQLAIGDVRYDIECVRDAVNAASIYKLDEEQRSLAILRLFLRVFKRNKGEPEKLFTDFPGMYRNDLEKNLDGIDPKLSYDDDYGLHYGEPGYIPNRIREYYPEMYKRAYNNLEATIASIFAGACRGGSIYGFYDDSILYALLPHGDDGGFAHAAVMAAINDYLVDAKEDDKLTKKTFEKYYIRPQKDWVVVKKAPNDWINKIDKDIPSENNNEENYIVLQGEKELGRSDNRIRALLIAMRNGHILGLKDDMPDWNILLA